MPAVSKKQQRFFGMVRAAQKGEGAASPEVAKVASEIKKKDAKDFASTKHKGLPMKKEETVFEGDVHSGQGEKIQKRTLEWMRKKGQKGAPGLDAMKARTAEHKAKRGVKEEVVDEKISASGYARAKKYREDQAREKDRKEQEYFAKKAKTHKWDGEKWNKRESVEYQVDEAEEVLDELSKATLASYIKHGSRDAVTRMGDASRAGMSGRRKEADKGYEKAHKRVAGVRTAATKLQYKKEEVTFEGWKEKAGDAIKKALKKKDAPKHDFGRDAGAEAAKRLRKKDHEKVNFLDPDD